MHQHNITAFRSGERGRPREYDANDYDATADDGLTHPPPGYPDDCAWLQPKELRKRNRELAKFGRRICRTHQGHALPLDEEHFYIVNRVVGYLDTECKDCHNERCRQSRLKRFMESAESAGKMREVWRAAQDRRRDAKNRQLRLRYREQKRARIQRALEGVA